jgi:Na+-translocating ferredoxin:NAD+ oxidoreductase subunit B
MEKALILLGGLGLVFGIFLTYFYMRFQTSENPLISKIYELLPKANCGGCGYPGCSSFAEALAEGKVSPEKCAMIGDSQYCEICKLLGVESKEKEKKVARVMCLGGKNARKKFEYETIKTCKAVEVFYDTNLECSYGCIGYGDCVNVCPVDAIKMGENGLPVIDQEMCIACGKCVEACPKNIIKLVPYDKKEYVACMSQDKGAAVVKSCKSGCIGCGKCVEVCPVDAIKLENNLASINYDKCINCGKCVEVCPRKIILVAHGKKEKVPVQNQQG